MSLSLETIEYQYNDRFPPALTAIVAALMAEAHLNSKGDTKYEIPKGHRLIAQLEQLILDRLGVRVVYSPELLYFTQFAVIPFFKDIQRTNSSFYVYATDSVKNNRLEATMAIGKILKERTNSLKKIEGKTGYINTKMAKMGGYFSEVKHYLIVSFNVKGLTPEELTAVILHELGHAFDGMEEHYRLQTTNRAIFDVLSSMNGNTPDKSLYTYNGVFTEKDYIKAQLGNSTDRQDFCMTVASRFVEAAKSQLQSSKYDETNFENMADTFATRFGMGKELASALTKLSGDSFRSSDSVRYVFTVIDILTMISVFLLLSVYGLIIYTAIMTYMLRISAKDMTYDEFGDRISRIRNTIVNGIKSKELPADIVKEAIDQLDFIDNIVKSTKNYSDLMSQLGNVIYPDARKDEYYMDLQKDIESHLNNQLFVHSARLRVSV